MGLLNFVDYLLEKIEFAECIPFIEAPTVRLIYTMPAGELVNCICYLISSNEEHAHSVLLLIIHVSELNAVINEECYYIHVWSDAVFVKFAHSFLFCGGDPEAASR